jgi:hypothetical protein
MRRAMVNECRGRVHALNCLSRGNSFVQVEVYVDVSTLSCSS